LLVFARNRIRYKSYCLSWPYKMEKLTLGIAFLALFSLTCSCRQSIRPKRDKYIPAPKDYVDIGHYRSPQEREGQHSDLAIAVAMSGGGSRAYGFAAGVLLGLEEVDNDMDRNFLHELDYLSTVSGGGFTAGCFIAARHAHLLRGSKQPFLLEDYYEGFVKESLLKSYSNPVILARFNPRTLFAHLDHGDALEKAINDQICGRKLRKRLGLPLESIRLGDIFIDKNDRESKVQFPLLVANASLTSNIRLFCFTPAILKHYRVSGYVHRFKNQQLDTLIDPYQMPLSVGLKASGTFPGAVMNTTLSAKYRGEKYLHLFDGGLADNVGWRAAIDMLKEDSIAKKRLLFVVDVDMSAYPRTYSERESGGFFISSLYRTPFSGLDSRRMMRNKEIEEKCSIFDITPIYLDFTALIEGNEVLPPERIYLTRERERLVSLINKGEKLTPLDLQILYELAVNIPTKYTLSPTELEFLVTIGKEVVRQQGERLRSFL